MVTPTWSPAARNFAKQASTTGHGLAVECDRRIQFGGVLVVLRVLRIEHARIADVGDRVRISRAFHVHQITPCALTSFKTLIASSTRRNNRSASFCRPGSVVTSSCGSLNQPLGLFVQPLALSATKNIPMGRRSVQWICNGFARPHAP